MSYFDRIDVDGDKRLSIKDVATAMSSVYEHEHERHAIGGSQHYLHEKNADDIKKHEETLLDRTAGAERPKTVAHIEKDFIRQVDAFLIAKDRNHDGKVSLKEYHWHAG